MVNLNFLGHSQLCLFNELDINKIVSNSYACVPIDLSEYLDKIYRNDDGELDATPSPVATLPKSLSILSSNSRNAQQQQILGKSAAICYSCCFFGMSLESVVSLENMRWPCSELSIPNILNQCISYIEKHLLVVGLYRISGSKAAVDILRKSYGKPNFSLASISDVHAVTSLLKLYFRELPEPLISGFSFASSSSKESNSANGNEFSKEGNSREILPKPANALEAIKYLAPVHRVTLLYFIKHLKRVASFSHENKMTPKNLALVLGPTLFGIEAWKNSSDESVSNTKDSKTQISSHVVDLNYACEFVENLIIK